MAPPSGLICPASWSDGLPAGPHGHCASTVPALSYPSGLLSSSSPPQSGGVTSETLASFCHMRQEVPPLVLSAFLVQGLLLLRHWHPLSHAVLDSPARLEVVRLAPEALALRLSPRLHFVTFAPFLCFFLARSLLRSAQAFLTS